MAVGRSHRKFVGAAAIVVAAGALVVPTMLRAGLGFVTPVTLPSQMSSGGPRWVADAADLGAKRWISGPPMEAPRGRSFSAATMLAAVVLAGVAAARAGAARARRGLVACRANLVATRPDQAIPWWDRLANPKIEEGIGIWAEKLNMTQIFQNEDGNSKMIPATILVVKRGGNVVTDKKWPEKHGYYAVQIGYDRYVPPEEHLKSAWGSRIGALARNELPPLKKLKEFRVRPEDWSKYEIGQKIIPSEIFKEGELVDVHSRSKGKGFQGSIARWGHARGPMTHGSKHHRRYGSVGAGTTPGRVLPMKKRPAWGGDHNHTQRGIKILKMIDRINKDNMPETIIVVAGTVAGYTAHTEKGGSYVYLHKKKNLQDGRFKRDPVWLWYTKLGEDVDQMVPLKGKKNGTRAWTWKTFWGRDTRWIAQEVKKYWPDGFPGYDHSSDPFYDGCDPTKAIKAPEW
mmetsp:Transcript_67641/g.188745  ORF Transcript_67641/g.188745 Transcript_67641/m.188745 type:complete len:457 (-) Transcript_67641:145-1515(-)